MNVEEKIEALGSMIKEIDSLIPLLGDADLRDFLVSDMVDIKSMLYPFKFTTFLEQNKAETVDEYYGYCSELLSDLRERVGGEV